MYSFRERCSHPALLLGTFSAIPHPVAVEVTARAGVDFLCIDWEHSQIDRERIEDLIRASDVHHVPAIVRVPGNGPEAIAAALDAGAAGVLIPRVSTREQAESAVKATRYHPIGERGVGPGRAASYGYRVFDYLKEANDSIALALQVETAQGLANIDEIVAVDGIDVIFVGPGDLSVSIGALGDGAQEKISAAIEIIIKATLRAGKKVGIFSPSAEDAGKWASRGISFFLLASDTMFLGLSLQAGVAAARAHDRTEPR